MVSSQNYKRQDVPNLYIIHDNIEYLVAKIL